MCHILADPIDLPKDLITRYPAPR